VVCSAAAGLPKDELCNGKDDDCDGETDEGFGLGQACSASVAGCPFDGVWACADDGSGEAECASDTPPCDDGDPCTVDQCDDSGACSHDAAPACCTVDGDCSAGLTCAGGVCEPVQCAPCETDADCEAPGAVCVSFPGGQRCALACAAAPCPPGFTCEALLEEPTTKLCLPDSGACACLPASGLACSGDLWVQIDGCGGPEQIVAVCANGCASEAGCCPDGTAPDGAACAPMSEPAEDASGSDDTAGGDATAGEDSGEPDASGVDTGEGQPSGDTADAPDTSGRTDTKTPDTGDAAGAGAGSAGGGVPPKDDGCRSASGLAGPFLWVFLAGLALAASVRRRRVAHPRDVV
jgi:hypothetical protein